MKFIAENAAVEVIAFDATPETFCVAGVIVGVAVAVTVILSENRSSVVGDVAQDATIRYPVVLRVTVGVPANTPFVPKVIPEAMFEIAVA